MPRKVKTPVRQFYQWCRCGDRWARLTIEWSEHPDLPQNWKDGAEKIAEAAFMSAWPSVHQIVDAQWGKSQKIG